MDIQKILTSDVVDLSSLISFFATDKDSLIQLIDVYVSDTAPRVETLNQSITTVDYEAVRSICHFLKSSLGLMGVSCLNEVAELEKQALNNDPEDVIKAKLQYVVPICQASVAEYQRILDQLKAL